MFDMLAQVAIHAPRIATQDSGVSWGALLAILGVIGTIGVGALSIFYSMIKNMGSELKQELEKQNLQFTSALMRVDEKSEKIESSAREARKGLWDRHSELKDKHGDRLTTVETTIQIMAQRTPIAGNPQV